MVVSRPPKECVEDKSRAIHRQTIGFFEVTVPGNGCNYVLIKFDAAETMGTFVAKNDTRAKSEGLCLKHNQPPGTLGDKLCGRSIWERKQKLSKSLSLPEGSDRVLPSRRRFWYSTENGESEAEVGNLVGETNIVWDAAASELLRNGA